MSKVQILVGSTRPNLMWWSVLEVTRAGVELPAAATPIRAAVDETEGEAI
jgi:hypothetical protein